MCASADRLSDGFLLSGMLTFGIGGTIGYHYASNLRIVVSKKLAYAGAAGHCKWSLAVETGMDYGISQRWYMAARGGLSEPGAA